MAKAAEINQTPVFNESTVTNDFSAKTIPRIPSRRVINKVQLSWHETFLKRLAVLTKLPDNWNGYGAGPVSFHVSNFAANMVASACPHHSQEPQIVPGADGDLQIEWHSLEYDIELHVRAPFDVVATRCAGEEVEEIHLSADFTVVAEWLNDLENAIATRATAG
jgi:hypothetical protein